jgi:hypothetical protein
MSDLKERFEALDALEAPDLQQEILTRLLRPGPAPNRQQRLVAGALAGLVAVLGLAVGGWVLLRLREAPQPVTEPSPGVTAPPQVHEVFDIERLPGGSKAVGVRGRLIARAEEGDRFWTVSATRRRDHLCLHLNSGAVCGGPTGPRTEAGSIGFFRSSEEGPQGPEVTFVYGPVVKRVAEVSISFNDGTTIRTRPIAGPPGFEVNFYVVGVRGTARVATVQALDRRGDVLGTVVSEQVGSDR